MSYLPGPDPVALRLYPYRPTSYNLDMGVYPYACNALGPLSNVKPQHFMLLYWVVTLYAHTYSFDTYACIVL